MINETYKSMLSGKSVIRELNEYANDFTRHPHLKPEDMFDYSLGNPSVPVPEAFNARIKALAARDNTGLPALADDSGLVVDALDGAPGVFSSRFAGEDATDADNNAKLLELLADVPDDERTARFVCTLVFVDTDDSEIVAYGSCEGKIGYEERGSNGFGYDPLFFADAFDGKLTTAEVPSGQKDAISHRGEALRAFIREFEKR